MITVTIEETTTGIEVLDRLASLPMTPPGWQITSVHHMTSQGDPIDYGVMIELWLPADYSFEGEPSDRYTAARARLSPSLEDQDDDTYALTGFGIDVDIMNHGLIEWSPPPDASVPSTTVGADVSVVDDPATPFQHSIHAEEPHLAGALETLGALMEHVEEYIERPMAAREPPEIAEEA